MLRSRLNAGDGAMLDYRLYYFDQNDHVLKAFDIAAPDDASAIAASQVHACEHIMELWRGTRCVAKFDPRHLRARAP